MGTLVVYCHDTTIHTEQTEIEPPDVIDRLSAGAWKMSKELEDIFSGGYQVFLPGRSWVMVLLPHVDNPSPVYQLKDGQR